MSTLNLNGKIPEIGYFYATIEISDLEKIPSTCTMRVPHIFK